MAPNLFPLSLSLLLAGFGDKVRCFSCQGELKKWRAGAVPMEEHRKMYKDCAAVKNERRHPEISNAQPNEVIL